ncbi:MAG TPA: hypothetical protein VHH36_06380, partial [Candidatus Thermoplasmatota archaeon]|nr:hypothetical protein [Candidatus Thermoplasmatota archaeon]
MSPCAACVAMPPRTECVACGAPLAPARPDPLSAAPPAVRRVASAHAVGGAVVAFAAALATFFGFVFEG